MPGLRYCQRRPAVAACCNLLGRGLTPCWSEDEPLPQERYYLLDHCADLLQGLLIDLREHLGAPVALAG